MQEKRIFRPAKILNKVLNREIIAVLQKKILSNNNKKTSVPFKTTTTTKELNQNGNSLQLQRVNDLIENKTKQKN